MRRPIAALAVVFVLLADVLPVVSVQAASGGLDPSFGVGGKVTTSFSGFDQEAASAVAIQADGKIVTAGEGGHTFALARYETNGSLDATFDGDGKVTTEFGSNAVAYAIAIQKKDGKIVVAGGSSNDGFVLARYNTDGSLDETFDDDGKLTTGFGNVAGAVEIQPDDKIIAAGLKADSSENAFALARYNSDGSLDTTFGGDGMVTTNHGGLYGATGDYGVNDIVLQADGKIVAAGMGGLASDFLLARYDTDGDLDPTYGTGGLAFTEFGGYDEANALVIQPDGKIVAAGLGNGRFALARYKTDGTLDTGFDGDGKVRTPFFGEDVESAHGMAIQDDGKIVVVGRARHNGDLSYAIARYQTDGWLDGRATTGFGDPADVGILCPADREDCSEDAANGVAIQSDGMIVVVGGGGVCGYPCDWTLARYTSIAPIRELTAVPSTVDFGSVGVSLPAAGLPVTITNTGSASVTLSLVELVGGGPAGMSITSQGCALAALAPRASCVIALRFAPLQTGQANAELRVHSDATASLLTVPLVGLGIPPPSGIAWGTLHKAGPAYTWNSGNGLARTVRSGAQKLHVAYATDRIGSSWARNSGPRMGIYYVRSSSGTTWTTPKRLNPSTQHAARLGVAAAGSRVYVTWVSQTRVTSFRPTAPRVLYVRVNTSHGKSTAWRSTVRLTSKTGRVDFPSIAASGTDVYITYTDSVTGAIRVATSHDRGVTWSKKTIGSTTASSSEGRIGYPSVSVSGVNAVVAWNADAAGTVAVRRSSDRGATWSTATTVTGDSLGSVTTAALGSRVAVTWTTGPEIHVREALAGTWGPDRLVGGIGPDGRFAYSPTVALQGTTRLAVAWTEKIQGDNGEARLNWTESANDGALWYQTQTLGSTSTYSRRSNDWPSVVWASGSTRQVLWNGWTSNTNYYRLYVRTGTGTPAGPALAAQGASGPSTRAPVAGSDHPLERLGAERRPTTGR